MNRSLILIYMMIICLSIIPTVYADVIEPGQKEVRTYYQITNIDSYLDYVFLSCGYPFYTNYMVLSSGEFSLYKFSIVSIYAVEKSNFDENELKKLNDTQIQEYFTNNIEVIHSNLEINGSYGFVNEMNPLREVVIELEITSLNQTHLEIKKKRIIYIYEDGARITANYRDQNVTPPPNYIPSGMDMIWYFLVPLIALTAMVLILIHRRSD